MVKFTLNNDGSEGRNSLLSEYFKPVLATVTTKPFPFPHLSPGQKTTNPQLTALQKS
jgi:hypothetical protein